MKKKIWLLLLIALFWLGNIGAVSPESKTKDQSIEDQLTDSVQDQLENIDLSPFEEFLASLDSEQYQLFGGTSFSDKLNAVLSGDFADGYDSAFSAFFSLVVRESVNFLPTLATMVIVAILCGMLSHMKPNFLSKGMGEVIYFVCYAVMIVLMLQSIVQLVQVATETMESMKRQMNVIFPIILTVMSGIGGVVSVKVYQPAVAVLAGMVLNIITAVVFPIFMVTCVLGICSNLSGNVKLDKLTDFFKSLSNWIIGITFTVFLAFLSIQGITAATHDGISIRAAKYAVSNSVPILGGYIKDGFDLILSGGVLIKNAFGVTGLVLLIATVAVPFIKLLVFMLGLKITAAITEPLTDNRISGFIASTAKSMQMLLVAVIGVAFMYFITIMLLMCTSNVL